MNTCNYADYGELSPDVPLRLANKSKYPCQRTAAWTIVLLDDCDGTSTVIHLCYEHNKFVESGYCNLSHRGESLHETVQVTVEVTHPFDPGAPDKFGVVVRDVTGPAYKDDPEMWFYQVKGAPKAVMQFLDEQRLVYWHENTLDDFIYESDRTLRTALALPRWPDESRLPWMNV